MPLPDSLLQTDWQTDTLCAVQQTMVEMSANSKSAKVVATTTFANGTAPIDLAVASSARMLQTDFLYVNAAGTQTIQRFQLLQKGQSKQLSAFDVAAQAKQRGVTLTKSIQGMAIFMMAD